MLQETSDRDLDCVLRYKRGCLYENIGEKEEAAEDFKSFLSADTRVAKGGSSPASVLYMMTQVVSIGNQRLHAKKFLSEYTFQKILTPSVPFDYYYQDKKLYDWGRVPISYTSEETNMLKNNPQEATYRKGVKCFLQGKHERALRNFDEAIAMNPEDAKCYLFRSMVHALQSQRIVHALPRPKGGVFGPSHSARKLSWYKFKSDLQRAKELSKNNEAVERACLRTKYWLVDYERELATEYASKPTPAARLLGFMGTFAGYTTSIIFLVEGIASIFMFNLPSFTPISIPAFISSGLLTLFGTRSVKRGKKLRGALMIILAFLIVVTFVVIFWGVDMFK